MVLLQFNAYFCFKWKLNWEVNSFQFDSTFLPLNLGYYPAYSMYPNLLTRSLSAMSHWLLNRNKKRGDEIMYVKTLGSFKVLWCLLILFGFQNHLNYHKHLTYAITLWPFASEKTNKKVLYLIQTFTEDFDAHFLKCFYY